MTRQEYLDALRAGLSGMPPDVVAGKIADYEQRFTDGAMFGRSADDVARDLGDPDKVAAGFRDSMHVVALVQQQSPPRDLWRLLMSLLGVTIFNLFMAIPAFAFSVMLLVSYVVAAASFAGGIALTASGLSGVDAMVMKAPFDHVRIDASTAADVKHDSEHLQLGPYSVQIDAETIPARTAGVANPANATGAASLNESGKLRISIGNDDDEWEMSGQTWKGIGLIFGGIAILLLSLVVTRYSAIGIKRYVLMNYGLLKNV